MRTKIIWILSMCILAAACKKRKYPDDKVQLEKEDIYCTGYIGGEPVTLKIGTDGYYCYSSYKQREDSIYMFEGELRKFDCNPCTRALKIELSDCRKRLTGFPVLADSAFRKGSRRFIPAMPRLYKVMLTAHSNKDIASLRWDFDNGASSQSQVTSYEFGQPGLQTVSLTVRTSGNCESTVINKIFVDGAGVFACDVAATLIQNNTTKFKASVIGGKAPFRYTWDFGDRTTSNSPEPVHSFQWTGSYPVKLRIEDADNHVCESNYIHVTGNDNSSCAANIGLSYAGSTEAVLDGVKIRWTDQSNAAFRSDGIAQPAESYFEIVDSQQYDPNEREEAGRLLTLRFNVLLSDGNRKLWFKSDNTAIAVTYK